MPRLTESARKPRIIIHTPEPSCGAALYVCELVKALAQNEAPVVLFCPSNFEYQSEARKAGADVVLASSRPVTPASLAARILRNFKFVAQTAYAQHRLTRKGDIVHFQFPLHLPLGFVFLFLVFVRGGSVVLTAHDPLPHKWRFPTFLRSFEQKMLHWFYQLCTLIIVHNETGKEVLVRKFKVPANRISIIPHGPVFDGELTGSHPACNPLRLLVFGAIRENKGVHLAIRAVQMVNSGCPPRVRLTIAGFPVHSQYWSECKQLIAKAPEYFDVIERFTPDAEVPPLLARHHAILLPYVDFSSESGVAALALSNQRPILATRSGGLGEILAQCNCGIPIESPTVESVAHAIVNAIDLGPERLLGMGIEGRRFLTKTRSWAFIARETLQVYSTLTHKLVNSPNGSLVPQRAPAPKDEMVETIPQCSSSATTNDFAGVERRVMPNPLTRSLPSFFVIGPARTGSSWLHQVLSDRTDLPRQKETYFFDSRFHRGVDWYRESFDKVADNRLMGEVAPTYFASPEARQRIARTIPNAKVICTFRNPVERVLSLYRLRRAHARIPWSFEEAIDRDPELMETSRYATHLKAWQTALGRDQVLVTMYEDLRSDPQSYVDRLADFIGVLRFPIAKEHSRYAYSSDGERLAYPRNQHLMRVARATADWLVEQRQFTVVSTLKKLPLTGRLLSSGQPFEQLSQEVLLRVHELFRPEVEELEAILNRDLTAWKYPSELLRDQAG